MVKQHCKFKFFFYNTDNVINNNFIHHINIYIYNMHVDTGPQKVEWFIQRNDY